MAKTQISFPLETELEVINSMTSGPETETFEAGEVIDVESMRVNKDGSTDIYLGGFRCVFNIPRNFQTV